MSDLEERRQWFEAYFRRIEQASLPPDTNERFTCPCCGYPTLGERGAYVICPLCSWEDDRQDDPHADEIWGGPNKNYSLTEARRNFAEHLIMYRPSDRTSYPQSPEMLALKRELIQIYERLKNAGTTAERAELEQQEQRIVNKMSITPQRKLPLP